MKHTTLFLAVLTLASCGSPGRQVNVTDSSALSDIYPEISDMTLTALAKADSAIALMTLEQKVGQCFMPSVMTDDSPSNIALLNDYINNLDVGGVVMLRGNLRAAARISSMGASASLPLFMAIDAEWGLGMRLKDAPGFPRNGSLNPKADEELLFDYGREVARECRRLGISMVLGPVIDVAENPNVAIGNRSFGADPVRVADLGVAYARGVESGGVISVAKHFPGHGSPQTDSHKSLPVVRRSLEELDSIDLYPFRHYIDAGLSGIMVGHLAVPAVDHLQLPAAVSPAVINGLLRKEMGFSGLVLTDAFNMGGARGFNAVDALRAGADIIVAPADTHSEIEIVVNAVRTGKLDLAIVERHCHRILFHKYLLNTGEPQRVSLDNLREDITIGTDSLRNRLEK